MIRELPASEFTERIRLLQDKIAEKGFDAYLVHANESDNANVRYLSDHQPIFETAGVLVPREGEPVLLIGPEAEPFARERSKIQKIRKLIAYREASEPDYPDMKVPTFRDVFDEVSNGKGIRRLALGDYAILTMPVYEGIKEALGQDGQIVRAEEIIHGMRAVKSEHEIALIKEAHRISESAFEEILGFLKPGLTEKEVLGKAMETLFRHGAESEAYPNYVFSGIKTRNAIGKASYDNLEQGRLIQFCIGARLGGYASSVGRPVMLGKMPAEMKKHVQFGLDVHKKTYEWIHEGIFASDVAHRYFKYFEDSGYARNFLYGPCHGAGISENEKPWVETNSTYSFQENMTFMADTFFSGEEYGFRWEDGFRVTKTGCEAFSSIRQEIIEL